MPRSVFIGVRSGSTRTLNKNTRPFLADGTSLLQNRILQLREVSCDEIIISSNCPNCLEQATFLRHFDQRIQIFERDKDLCRNNTLVTDLMTHICHVCSFDDIMWTHVTTPFISPAMLNEAFEIYESEKNFDSFVSVNKIQNFLWNQKKNMVINNPNSKNKWPNTQQLSPLFEFNHGIYICSKELLAQGERVGKTPYLYNFKGESKLDIDWEDDFVFAQKISKYSNSVRHLTMLHDTSIN